MECFICGQEMSCSIEMYHYKECGLDNVYLVNVEVCRCPGCNEKVVSIPALPALNTAIGEDLLQKESRLNGKEIRFLRKNMGMKSVDLQRYLGVDNATISRWESGKQKISLPNDRLLRVVYAHMKGIPTDRITSLVRDGFVQIKPKEMVSRLYRIDINSICPLYQLPALQ